MLTIYYLLHWEADRRLRPYKTQAGARIACRLRNQHLGFKLRIDREQRATREYELYCVEGTRVRGTYCIESARVTTLELFTELQATNDKAQ